MQNIIQNSKKFKKILNFAFSDTYNYCIHFFFKIESIFDLMRVCPFLYQFFFCFVHGFIEINIRIFYYF